MNAASASPGTPEGKEADGVTRRRPEPLSELVSRQMSAMPSRDTGTEMALRRELHSRGLRYQTHLKTLPRQT